MKQMIALKTLCALMMLYFAIPMTIYAAEKGVVELEEVSDAEKVKWARATKILVTEAIKTAIAHTPGQVIEASLHSINGRLLYEIEVVTKDGHVIELFIDPQTGTLIQLGDKP